jgi:hypothetical protein
MFGLMLGQVNYSDSGPSETTAARTSTAPILGTKTPGAANNTASHPCCTAFWLAFGTHALLTPLDQRLVSQLNGPQHYPQPGAP